MKKNPLLIIATVLLLSGLTVKAQTTPTGWLIAGNSNITTSKFLGTTNNQPLIVKTNNAERMRVLGNGNVGIGTATPENKLHVFKGSAGSVTGYVNAPLIVENSTHSFINILAPDNAETGILFGKPSGNTSGGIIYNESGNWNGFQFRTNGNVTQMVLNSAGNVGIGTISPQARLNVESENLIAFQGRCTNDIGIFGNSLNSPAIYGYSTNSVGIYGVSTNYRGVVGYTANSNEYAGYFSGNVYSTGSYLGSDQKLKQNIVDFGNAIQVINRLQPKVYEYRQDGAYKLMNLPQGKHYGLIAQDVEQVLPNMVKETRFDTKDIQPPSKRKEGEQQPSEIINFKALNYTELIPILVKAMQEQQAQIETQQKQNDALFVRIEKLEALLNANNINTNSSLAAASLGQNQPNPFNKSTIIRYNIPHGSKGQINIFDQTGKLVKTLNANESGQSNLNGNDLAAGMYTYTLMVNGKVIGSKQMVVAR